MIPSAFCKRPATLVGVLLLYVVGYVIWQNIIPLGACLAETRLHPTEQKVSTLPYP